MAVQRLEWATGALVLAPACFADGRIPHAPPFEPGNRRHCAFDFKSAEMRHVINQRPEPEITFSNPLPPALTNTHAQWIHIAPPPEKLEARVTGRSLRLAGDWRRDTTYSVTLLRGFPADEAFQLSEPVALACRSAARRFPPLFPAFNTVQSRAGDGLFALAVNVRKVRSGPNGPTRRPSFTPCAVTRPTTRPSPGRRGIGGRIMNWFPAGPFFRQNSRARTSPMPPAKSNWTGTGCCKGERPAWCSWRPNGCRRSGRPNRRWAPRPSSNSPTLAWCGRPAERKSRCSCSPASRAGRSKTPASGSVPTRMKTCGRR